MSDKQIETTLQRPLLADIAFNQPTLRDQFAMAALTGELAREDWHTHEPTLAAQCYRYADAMLAVREGK